MTDPRYCLCLIDDDGEQTPLYWANDLHTVAAWLKANREAGADYIVWDEETGRAIYERDLHDFNNRRKTGRNGG